MDIGIFLATAVAGRFLLHTNGGAKRSTPASPEQLSAELLQKQNAETSSALIEQYAGSLLFNKLALYEGGQTMQRDAEDASKLVKGIEFAQKKGVIDPNFKPEPYNSIDVVGKSPKMVADMILEDLGKKKGSVIVIVGLSGTGKGTTVATLKQLLEDQKRSVTCWSNGNVFRSVTLLAATWCEKNCEAGKFDKERALTKERLEEYLSMLNFEKNSKGNYDIRINGLGMDVYVSDVQNTLLKSPKVSKNIPTVAEFTQGEVILFAAQAISILGENNVFVLLEGREQTVNYVRSPHRFNLVLSDQSLIGKRRAAQRLMGLGYENYQKGGGSVTSCLDSALERMVNEI